jgi:hypothetical protein
MDSEINNSDMDVEGTVNGEEDLFEIDIIKLKLSEEDFKTGYFK